MFNLFGSFFFGSRQVEQNAATENNNEQHMEEARVNSDASTQTLDAAQQLLMVSTHHDQEDALQKQWVIVERAKQEQQQPPQVAEASTSTHLLEDVKEEEETMPSVPEREDDDEDVLLGSFFDRNQVDDSAKTSQVVTAVPQKDEWLITPLPCLTSITCSQRSIENDPLENLLIEHPSMSVFVTVTQSVVDEDQTQVVKPAESNVRRKEDSLTSPPVVMMTQSPSQKKRKGMESTSPQAQVPQISPASTMRRSKASKKNKKSSAVSASSQQQQQQQQQSPVSCQSNQVANKENKENVMRTLEVRSKAVNSAAKLDSILLSKNQMKRNNKHAFKFNSNNCIQRKFHKLQQPVCC